MATSTSRTNADWKTTFSSLQHTLDTVPAKQSYACPVPGSSTFAKLIDHTLLAVSATPLDIDALCSEARTYEFASVCVRPEYVPRCVDNLKGSTVLVCTVIGFPEGTQSTESKVAEAKKAVAEGATEVDMVLNYDAFLKKDDYAAAYADVLAVRQAVPHPAVLKVILETSQLSNNEIVAASKLCCDAKVDFIKTSTGFRGHGATVEAVSLMKSVAEAESKTDKSHVVKVKASGGIRTLEDCVKMVEAGAERIGASAGVKIMKESKGAAVEDHAATDGY